MFQSFADDGRSQRLSSRTLFVKISKETCYVLQTTRCILSMLKVQVLEFIQCIQVLAHLMIFRELTLDTSKHIGSDIVLKSSHVSGTFIILNMTH